MILNRVKRILPHEWRQALKRRLFQHQDMLSRLSNLQRAGFTPNRALDIGAYEGSWTQECLKVWPDLPSVMIEPLSSKRQLLQTLADRVCGSTVISCAVGNEERPVVYRVSETNSGIVGAGTPGAEEIMVRCRKIDEIMLELGGAPADLVKIDVQGHELEVLRGGPITMKAAEVIILEVSILAIGDVPIFREVDRFMGVAGFRVYDLIPQYYRPLDGALWQIDCFYVRETSPLIVSRAWD